MIHSMTEKEKMVMETFNNLHTSAGYPGTKLGDRNGLALISVDNEQESLKIPEGVACIACDRLKPNEKPLLKELALPSSCTKILQCGLYGMSELVVVYGIENVKEFGQACLEGTNISQPISLISPKRIEGMTFAETKLTKINLGTITELVGRYIFFGCKVSEVVGDYLAEISGNPFGNCKIDQLSLCGCPDGIALRNSSFIFTNIGYLRFRKINVMEDSVFLGAKIDLMTADYVDVLNIKALERSEIKKLRINRLSSLCECERFEVKRKIRIKVQSAPIQVREKLEQMDWLFHPECTD